LQFKYFLAELLHKTVAEIMEMDIREYMGWSAYFRLKEERQKRAK